MTIQTAVIPAFAAVFLFASTAFAGPGRDGGAAFRAACAPDIAKFCADVPRGKALHMCVRSHHVELSEGCRAFMYEKHGGEQPPPEEAPVPQPAPSPAPAPAPAPK